MKRKNNYIHFLKRNYSLENNYKSVSKITCVKN